MAHVPGFRMHLDGTTGKLERAVAAINHRPGAMQTIIILIGAEIAISLYEMFTRVV